MKNKRATGYQYEPLVTPSKWSGEEKQFALRLTQALDDLYNKYGKMLERLKEIEKNGNV